MFPPLRRFIIIAILAISFFIVTFHSFPRPAHHHGHGKRHERHDQLQRILHPGFFGSKFKWTNVKQKFPVQTFATLPTGPAHSIPKIQYDFKSESSERVAERKRRLRAIEESFRHSWEGYKKNAWLQDEVTPVSGSYRNPFGSWAATLVDSLDTLLIMGLKSEFNDALSGLKHIDFATSPQHELNVFETTIRYLGGLLSAYDLSEHKHHILLQKATELGNMLYHAFDTPNRMPITRWDWQQAVLGEEQKPSKHALLAEVGSFMLEFTRLSQLTGDPKWYDAIARVTNNLENWQNDTRLPGLWPVTVDMTTGASSQKDSTFTIGGMADSLYEYLPKEHILLGGHSGQYRNMFLTALPAAKEHIFFRPLNPRNVPMLLPGNVKKYSAKPKLTPDGEHLACFAGGMVALAAKIFHQPNELETARELVEGCYWAYSSMPSGIMPEIFTTMPCQSKNLKDCTWNDDLWKRAVAEKANRGSVPDGYISKAQKVIAEGKLAPGFTEIRDPRFLLRPEAIESLFVLYRVTGDVKLQDMAWEMFQSINNATRTEVAHAALKDVRQLGAEREHLDNMESFWTAETLKYFYLIFSEPDVISLDEYVL